MTVIAALVLAATPVAAAAPVPQPALPGAERSAGGSVLPAPEAPVSPAATATGGAAVPVGTPVRLMVVREVTSRTSKPGDRFELRVDEPVWIDGKPVVPVGTKAWGEVVAAQGNGAAGKGGRIGARLLYVDLPGGPLPLRGDVQERGAGNGAGVVLAVVGFGLLGLLTAGDSARLKGGQTFTAYVDAAK